MPLSLSFISFLSLPRKRIYFLKTLLIQLSSKNTCGAERSQYNGYIDVAKRHSVKKRWDREPLPCDSLGHCLHWEIKESPSTPKSPCVHSGKDNRSKRKRAYCIQCCSLLLVLLDTVYQAVCVCVTHRSHSKTQPPDRQTHVDTHVPLK